MTPNPLKILLSTFNEASFVRFICKHPFDVNQAKKDFNNCKSKDNVVLSMAYGLINDKKILEKLREVFPSHFNDVSLETGGRLFLEDLLKNYVPQKKDTREAREIKASRLFYILKIIGDQI